MNLTRNLLRKRITNVFPVVIVITAFSLISGAQAKSSTGGTSLCKGCVNVTSTVFDLDSSGALLLFKSDDHNGDYGTYTTGTAAGNSNIESFIDSSGVWFLNLYPQKTGTRTVYITPNDPVISGEQDVAPPAQYWQNVEITSKCMDAPGGNTVPFANLVNGSSICSFGIDFGYNGVVYKLLLGRTLNAGDPTPDMASVSCNALNSSHTQCVNWTISAGNGTSPVKANLYSNTAGWVFIGQYYNSVRVNIAKP